MSERDIVGNRRGGCRGAHVSWKQRITGGMGTIWGCSALTLHAAPQHRLTELFPLLKEPKAGTGESAGGGGRYSAH